MFCYLYVMFDNTSIPLFEKEKCFEECEFFDKGNCSIGFKRAENLSTSRYGWVMQNVIVFKEGVSQSKSGNTKYLSAISLIHPSTPDIWVVKCHRLNKAEENDWYTVYRLHRQGGCTEFDDLTSLNKWMRRQQKYDGRKIIEEDFSKRVEND